MTLFQEGQTIRDTYKVERFLGEGAFAEVYRVKHHILGRQAMKVFKAVGMTIQETKEMLAEAVLLSRLGHPNIIRVFEANVIDTAHGVCGYFTMEYVAGGNLEMFWQSFGGRLVPVETTVEVIRQVCRGMAVAHSAIPPIIHRDIKPQNILVGYTDIGTLVRVGDFGLAKHVNPITLLASARGTVTFKAPEALRDPEADSCAGDVWAIGQTLYLLLTDRLPYPDVLAGGLTINEFFKYTVIPPSRLNLAVDDLLDHITLRALALKPEDRYPTARELLIDLEQWKIRPLTESLSKPDLNIEATKPILGVYSPLDQTRAHDLISQARQLAYDNQMKEAADLLEEALNKWPGLRERHEYRLKLWRRGIIG